jgi:hypothetical protein
MNLGLGFIICAIKKVKYAMKIYNKLANIFQTIIMRITLEHIE